MYLGKQVLIQEACLKQLELYSIENNENLDLESQSIIKAELMITIDNIVILQRFLQLIDDDTIQDI